MKKISLNFGLKPNSDKKQNRMICTYKHSLAASWDSPWDGVAALNLRHGNGSIGDNVYPSFFIIISNEERKRFNPSFPFLFAVWKAVLGQSRVTGPPMRMLQCGGEDPEQRPSPPHTHLVTPTSASHPHLALCSLKTGQKWKDSHQRPELSSL